MTPELERLLERARIAVAAMTPEQLAEMHRQQRESWVRAEMSWPNPNFHWEGSTKVYHSWEDYCND